MNKKAVPVGDLQFGMYIAELDRPWTETPFAFQGFWLPTDLPREIEAATLVYSRTCEALAELLEPLERGATRLEGAEVAKLVEQLADSVIRNPEALLLLSKVREIRTPAHARALQVSVYMMVSGRFLQREPDEIELLGLLGLLQ